MISSEDLFLVEKPHLKKKEKLFHIRGI